MVERARATATVSTSLPSFLPNWIARYLNDGIVIALLLPLDPSDHRRLRLRDTEVVKINLWRWRRQQLSIRHLRLSLSGNGLGSSLTRARAMDGDEFEKTQEEKS